MESGKQNVMENKQYPSRKNLISIQEEKLIREVDYDSLIGGSNRLIRKQLLDLEILHKGPPHHPSSQRVLVSIKPKAPAIKTIYIAEKNRFHAKKSSDKSVSRLAIGDHPSLTTHFSGNESKIINPTGYNTKQRHRIREIESEKVSSITIQIETSISLSKCSHSDDLSSDIKVYNAKQRPVEKCYVYTQQQLNMSLPRVNTKIYEQALSTAKVDIATLIVTNTSSEDTAPAVSTIDQLQKRIELLEHKILKQEMVFRSIDPNIPLLSSDEENKDNIMNTASGTAAPGCSYIQQYSHVPETSAFQRYAQQAAPLSPSKATTLEKEHNSEQYGRDFTTYDGITARGRRQCASVTCKRDDVSKLAAERTQKIRNKLNPIRDYRLMDTVHYLAQGEFAPRDDGIKLTPSREAVLSDIIWEDVCRTHWPNTRLSRRVAHSERCSTRCELQRLIDNLLRERVAHVERRRRRHYRIVKLNHRHESCRPVGKTGDIIVASHKNRQGDEVAISDHNAASDMFSDRKWDESSRRNPRSHDRTSTEFRQNRRSLNHRMGEEECSPGPSYAANRPAANREPTCCYQASSPIKPNRKTEKPRRNGSRELTSGSSSSYKPKNPRLLLKKDASRRKHTKDEPNLEHYILLPTLVVRTPSNMKRQKKFNELYHRILNTQLNNIQHQCDGSESAVTSISLGPDKKDIGLNIHITLTDSAEKLE